jgi:ferric uptake regulator family protein
MNFSVVQQKHNKPAINHEQMQVRSVINYAAAKERLRTLNIRATGPRVILASLLFSGGNRHVTAEMLHGQAIEAGMPISLATVYNTLRQFVKSGLINVLTTDRTRRRRDNIDANFGGKLQSHGPAERFDGTFGRYVDSRVRYRPAGNRRTDVDDSSARLFQRGSEMVRAEKDAHNIDVDLLPKLCRVGIKERADSDDSGIVDQRVDFSEVVRDSRRCPLDHAIIGNVARVGKQSVAGCACEVFRASAQDCNPPSIPTQCFCNM